MKASLIPVVFAGTVFLGSMLAFQIQPLISRSLLPWFGGGPSVWTVCLLFFQTTLFLGYYYAFRLIGCLRVAHQVLIHLAFIAAALCMPVLPAPLWKPQSDGSPEWQILLRLATHTGLPFLVLSATSPLLQVWFLRAFPDRSPYRLYACSNAGSLFGLIVVPFALELWLSLAQQATLWYGCFVVWSGMTIGCGYITVKISASHAHVADSVRNSKTALKASRWSARATVGHWGLWFLLSMTPVVMLGAITSQLTMDVSPIPFLWIVPMAIYLGSLMVCFSWERLATRRIWMPACGLLLLVSGICLSMKDSSWVHSSLTFQFVMHLGTLAAVCMVCHGDLVRLKPAVGDDHGVGDQRLAEFYLVMALGGVAGGALTAVIAPLIFPTYWEYHLGLLASAAAPLIVLWREANPQVRDFRQWNATTFSFAGFLVLALMVILNVTTTLQRTYLISRSFFGVSRVLERRSEGSPGPYAFELVHGTTIHGFQFVSPELMNYPTTYYSPSSGVGIAMQNHYVTRPRRIGIIGLGVGTLAAYGRSGDVLDFYEIDPVVRDLAHQFFRYLSRSPATISIIPGDGRLSLERRELGRPYDLLVLDAFSSDAIPVHLVTAEAFAIYQRHIADDGIVAIHISNHNFDLRPVLLGNAQQLKWSAICIEDIRFDASRMTLPTYWVLMSPQRNSLESGEIAKANTVPMTDAILWTDERHSLFRILKSPSM